LIASWKTLPSSDSQEQGAAGSTGDGLTTGRALCVARDPTPSENRRLPRLLGHAGKRYSDRWSEAQTATCSWISSRCSPQLTLALAAFSWPTAAARLGCGCEGDGCRRRAGGGGEQQLRTPSLPLTAHGPLSHPLRAGPSEGCDLNSLV